MRIGIYNEAVAGSVGGSEYSVAVLAQALARHHDAEIVHHRPGLGEELRRFFGRDDRPVATRYIPPSPDTFGRARAPWRRHREIRSWHSQVSEPYDLFVNFAHHVPPFCHARAGVLVVLFPMFDRRQAWPWRPAAPGRLAARERLRAAYFDWDWRQRMATYQVKVAISRFTRDWAARRWQIDCDVIYPPVETDVPRGQKDRLVLSVGRFSGSLPKRQVELASAFAEVSSHGLDGWRYECVGGLGDSPKDQAYFEEVRRAGRGSPMSVTANLEHASLRRLFQSAYIFWHALGYGDDDQLHPERAEHFGIVTVEAMAAGCVPVVHRKGGQAEIVEHGLNGFLWDTLPELKDYTLRLAHDADLRASMSEAARLRARTFSRECFVNAFLRQLAPYTRPDRYA